MAHTIHMQVLGGSDDDFATVRQKAMASPCPKSTGEAAGDANTLNTLLYGHVKTDANISKPGWNIFYLAVRRNEITTIPTKPRLVREGPLYRLMTIP
jgi:hypothetical protein